MATGSRQAIARSDCSSQVSSSNVHWVDATHYAVDYTVADANTTLASVTFDVSGAKDFDGNTQVAATNVASGTAIDTQNPTVRSEERRVGKESSSRTSPYHYNKNTV